MVFSSLLFLFQFLPAVLIAYLLVPKKLKNGLLFLASLIFYAWGEPVYVSLLLFSTLVDYVHGRLVHRYMEEGKQGKAKLAVASSVIINLSLLGFFKYADFLLGSVNRTFGLSLPLLGLALPIGISFYTFQTMSYTIDVYRGQAPVQKNIIAFGTYVSMFPQLIAGPIVRYQTIAWELDNRKESAGDFSLGVRRFVQGLGKKVLLANQFGLLWDSVKALPIQEQSVLLSWLGIAAFGLQIYYDFSGYSDMAIGLGRMFGFHFPENFDHPYLSKSITEFWRRWHISLGTWFREYVYIPLGGNKKGLPRQIINILIVWMLTGIWHGAGWNFLAWGLYFGALLILEKAVLLKYLNRMPGWFCRLYALLFVFGGWVLFAFDSLGQGGNYLLSMFGIGGMGTIALVSGRAWYLLYNYGFILAAGILGAGVLPQRCAGRLWEKVKSPVWRAVIENTFLLLIIVLCTAYLVDAAYNPFLYFRF